MVVVSVLVNEHHGCEVLCVQKTLLNTNYRLSSLPQVTSDLVHNDLVIEYQLLPVMNVGVR